jgi:hypothetical protein
MFGRVSPGPARARTNENLPRFGLAPGPRVDQADADRASAWAAPPTNANIDHEAQQTQREPHWPRLRLSHERALAVTELVAICASDCPTRLPVGDDPPQTLEWRTLGNEIHPRTSPDRKRDYCDPEQNVDQGCSEAEAQRRRAQLGSPAEQTPRRHFPQLKRRARH